MPSKRISSTLFPSTKLEVMKSSISSNLLRQLFEGTKPCCALVTNLFSIRCPKNSSRIILSSIFEVTGYRSIVGSDGYMPLLKIGLMFVNLHEFGILFNKISIFNKKNFIVSIFYIYEPN